MLQTGFRVGPFQMKQHFDVHFASNFEVGIFFGLAHLPKTIKMQHDMNLQKRDTRERLHWRLCEGRKRQPSRCEALTVVPVLSFRWKTFEYMK